MASIEFFKEGLVYLYEVKPNEEDGKKTQHGEDSAVTPLKQDVGSPEASVKTVSLAEEMRSLQLTDRDSSSGRALNHAKDRFKQARERATLASCNEALSTSDRILAMQYRNTGDNTGEGKIVLPTRYRPADCALKYYIPCQRSRKALMFISSEALSLCLTKPNVKTQFVLFVA